jgi:2-methylisocitrate lyase-like PEP mutase family enzyme
VAALKAPINVVGKSGMAPVATLEKIGVARVSTASGPSLAVLGVIQNIGQTLHRDGTFDGLASQVTRAEVQKLFAPRAD